MKIAVVGTGGMGRHHVRVCNELGVLAAVVDTNPITASHFASTYQIDAYTNINDLIKKKEIDAVIIAVPTPAHLSVATVCLEAGYHILLEKPLSNTIEKATEIVEAARAAKRILATGYIERFNPAFKALKAEIENKTFGEITSVNIKRVGGIPRSADNVILDLMTHDFNLLMALFDRRPTKIYTHTHYRTGILDSAQVLLDFDSASATCEANWISPIKIRTISLTGTEGYCEVDLIRQQITKILDEKKRTIQYFDKEPLKEEILSFIEVVKKNSLNGIVTGEDALRTLEITLLALENK